MIIIRAHNSDSSLIQFFFISISLQDLFFLLYCSDLNSFYICIHFCIHRCINCVNFNIFLFCFYFFFIFM